MRLAHYAAVRGSGVKNRKLQVIGTDTFSPFQNPHLNMKTIHLNGVALAVAVVLLIPLVTEAASKVTFDNQSGRPALVKLAGPTATSVSVENGKKESVSVAPGHYYIKIRYGTPGAYSYSKGDEFDVKETATIASDITITLHKVVAGNYNSHPITESEFGADEHTDEQAPAGKVNTEALKKLLPEFGNIRYSETPPPNGIDGYADPALIGLSLSDKKKKLFDKLDAVGAVGLLDLVAEMDTWDLRFEYNDFIIEKAVPVATVRKVLGKEWTTGHTEMKFQQDPRSLSSTWEKVDNWLGYGRWNFGVINDEVVVIRIYFDFTDPKDIAQKIVNLVKAGDMAGAKKIVDGINNKSLRTLVQQEVEMGLKQ
jgi:hypothetical protein